MIFFKQIVVSVYIVLFVALIFTGYRNNVNRVNKRRRTHRIKRLSNTLIECRHDSGQVMSLTDSTTNGGTPV